MIVLDQQHHDQTKLELDHAFNGSTLRLPERTFNRSSISLPDYQTSQLQNRNRIVSVFEIDDGSSTATNTSYLKRQLESFRGRRLWRVLGYAVLVYIVLAGCLGVPLLLLKLRHRERESRLSWIPPPSWNAPVSSSSPLSMERLMSDGTSKPDCNNWNTTSQSQQYFYASLVREFPKFDTFAIESDYDYNISNSRALFGSLQVDVNPNKKAKNLEMLVNLQSTSASLINNTIFCFFDEYAARGLKITAPMNLTQDDLLNLYIKVLLPDKQEKGPTSFIAQFSTYLPAFRQNFGSLKNYAFGDVRIEGPLSNITVEGETVALKSSLAPLAGNFTVSQSLSLDTFGSPIWVNAILSPNDSTGSPSLTATTGNGEIKANIILMNSPSSTVKDNDGPSTFIAELSSFNGSITVNASHAATCPPAKLFMRVQNNLGTANVSLDRKFTGTFDVQTKLAPVSVVGSSSAPKKTANSTATASSPTFYTSNSPERSYGWVNLGMNPSTDMLAEYGHVEVTSSIGAVALMIDGFGSSHDDDRLAV